MHIVITGGAGYIGSVATLALLEAGHTVTVLDNLSHGHQDAVPAGVRFVQGSVADFDAIIPQDEGIDAVIHLGAFMAAGESMNVPEKYWQNNTVNTLSMLNALRKRGISKLIFASTAAVYGNPDTIPITEDAPTRPTSTYGMTKLAMDMAITSESWAYGMSAASLRFFNVAGAYKSAGERHPTETHIIPLLFDAATGKRPFMMYGNDYPTADGTCIRDYIHVYDLARAMLLALGAMEPGVHNIYNLANGQGFSNKQVIDVVKQVTGKDFEVAVGPRREGDPAVLIASSQKAKDELGWEPSRPSLEQMVGDAWEYYLSRS
jgi:UDP-glucose 4-epimerase